MKNNLINSSVTPYSIPIFFLSLFLLVLMTCNSCQAVKIESSERQPENNNKNLNFESFLNINLENWTIDSTSIYIASKDSFDFNKLAKHYNRHILFLPLSDFLNTQAKDLVPIFKESGVDSVLKQTYIYNSYKINMEVYKCKNVFSARTLFSILKHGSTNTFTQGNISCEDDLGMWLCLDNFFIIIKTSNIEDETEKKAVVNLASQISKLTVSQTDSPYILGRLPSFGKIDGSEKLINGEESARYIYKIPLFDDLKLANFLTGAVCDYRMEEPYKERLKVMLLKFKDHDSASVVFDEYVASLDHSDSIKKIRQKIDHEYEMSSPSTDKSYPQIYKIQNRFMLCQTGDKYFLVIKNARKPESLLELARSILY